MMLLCVLFGPAAAGRLGHITPSSCSTRPCARNWVNFCSCFARKFATRRGMRSCLRTFHWPCTAATAGKKSWPLWACAQQWKSGSAPRGCCLPCATRSNLLFVTLEKIEKDYSPTTMYKDYAISARRFHWQSQSRTSAASTKGRRHTDHQGQDITPLLFVRTRKRENGRTKPYLFLGPLMYVRHDGDRPMSILWALAHAHAGGLPSGGSGGRVGQAATPMGPCSLVPAVLPMLTILPTSAIESARRS